MENTEPREEEKKNPGVLSFCRLAEILRGRIDGDDMEEGGMELNILGSTYKVDFVDSISRDELRLGETDYLNQTIKILSGLHSDLETVTLIHEILHVIFNQLEFVEENNEHLVQSLATSLYQVFSENEIF